MKIKFTTLVFISLLSCNSFANNEANINENNILGKWECTTNLNGLFVQTDTITYHRNNRFNAEGTVITAINFSTFQPEAAAYSTKGNGTWSIKDNFFLTVTEEFEASNINPKIQNDKFLDEINKSVQKGTTESSETKFFNKKLWLVEHENENYLSLCTKINPNQQN